MRAEGTTPIPVVRMREKLDTYVNRRDYDGAARHLEYWLAEARAAGDGRGEFVVLNEMMGVYRKKGDRDRALQSADAAVALIEVLDNGNTIGAGTAYVNAGTVCDCFGLPEKALSHFEAAKAVYENSLPPEDERLGGLYNNMALALADLGRYEEAFSFYEKALAVMELQPKGKLEQAITYLNMANAAEAMRGFEAAEEEINDYLRTAEALLSDPALPRDGYYAFVCEKCAPTFGYYGWFLTASELRQTSEELYARGSQ